MSLLRGAPIVHFGSVNGDEWANVSPSLGVTAESSRFAVRPGAFCRMHAQAGAGERGRIDTVRNLKGRNPTTFTVFLRFSSRSSLVRARRRTFFWETPAQ
jgi:hypothetical protein